MKSQVQNKLKKLPESPGVYFFLKGKKILYIGKATSLRDRVRSYFSGKIEETRGPLISKMLNEFTDIKFQKTDSVLEALILEANLIKKHQPEANTDLKDDKSFNYVVITDEDWPRVLVMRQKEIEKILSPHSSKCTDIFLLENSSCSRQSRSQGISRKDGSEFFTTSHLFGPFPNAGQLKEAMKLVRKIFPYRDKCIPASEQKIKKPLVPRSFSGVGCFNRQLGLCPGVCTGEISQKDYAKQIKNIVLFFEGKKKTLIKNLEKQMKAFAKAREFEKATAVKKTIFALNHIQDVVLIKENTTRGALVGFRIEAYDIAHMSGQNMVGVMTVVENGEVKKSDYRKFHIKGPGLRQGYGGQASVGDTQALSEILSRRLNHSEWSLPNLIVVDGGAAQKRAAEKVLLRRLGSEDRPEASARDGGFEIPVVSVVKDEYHRPREILGGKEKTKYENEILLANAEAHRFAIGFHRKLRGRLE